MDKIIVTSTGLFLLAFIYWFFFGKKSSEAGSGSAGEETRDNWEIVVEGGYKPGTITIPKGEPVTLVFNRKDPSPCLEEIVLSDFKIRKFLPLNQKTEITITPDKTGTFPFSCGMGMFHGKVVVKDK